jgi:hypothetical protein
VILVDTTVWVDHLRLSEDALTEFLEREMVLAHPFVIGEVALGRFRERVSILNALSRLPRAAVASHVEVLHFIDRHELFGRGIGYVDAHLLAAVRLTSGASLWTRDKRLHGVADQLGLATPRRA